MRTVLLLVVAGCAAPVAEVAWRACPVVRTADGRDIDDGGVDVSLEVRGARAQQVSIGHFPGVCRAAAGAGTTLVCSDPHVDTRYELSWARDARGSLTVERREYAAAALDGAAPPADPALRRVVATVDLGDARPVPGTARCP